MVSRNLLHFSILLSSDFLVNLAGGYKLSESSDNNNLQDAERRVLNTTNQNGNYNDYGELKDFQEYEKSNVSLDTFFAFLVNVSKQQIKKVHKNIRRDYSLNKTEVVFIDNIFQNCDWEYSLNINRYFKKMVSNISRGKKLSLSDFTDFSHFLIQEIIENNLKLVQTELSFPKIWSTKSFQQKILRQQMKIVMNVIDSQICWGLSLCVKHNVYTDYLVEWLRHILSASSKQLDSLFGAIIPSLDKFMHLIITNVKFRHKIKYMVHTDDSARKDFIDFIDEIFTNEDEIIHIMPTELKKSAVLLIDLFQLIDDNYNLNDENEIRLNSISKMLFKWANDENIDIAKIIETIVHNLELNIKIWPLPEQKRLEFIWSQILSL